MKELRFWILVIVGIMSGQWASAQSYSDSILALPILLKTEQQVWLERGVAIEKKATQTEAVLNLKLQEIERLNQQAEAEIQSKKKRKLLQQVLSSEAELKKIKKDLYLQQAEANRYYRQVLEAALDDKLGASYAIAYEQAVSNSKSFFKRTQSRYKKIERLEDDEQIYDVARDLLIDYEAGLSQLLYAIKLCYKLITPNQISDTEIVAAQSNEMKLDSESFVEIDYNPSQTSPEAESTVYRVQIAASEVELNTEQLHAIYNPPASDVIYSELNDGWYKYTVGKFDTYAEAVKYKLEIGVKGAFVISYQKDRRVSLQTSAKTGQVQPTDSIDGIAVVYRVQIAATRQPVDPQGIKGLRMGSQIVIIAYQDGWYKYTLGNFSTLEQAQKKLEMLAVPGAFIAAYDMSGQEIKKIGI